MDNRFFITVCSDRFQDEILLETQGSLKVSELRADLLKILDWPVEIDGRAVCYSLKTETKELTSTDTLASAGVANFEAIWISPIQGGEDVPRAASEENTRADTPVSEPYWTRIAVEKPVLIHPEGYMIILGTPPVLIGRHGGSEPVHVDLTEFEKDRLVSSRRHAEIISEDGEFYLRALKTRNGTFVGRDEILPGVSRLLKDNDVIQFGSGGVRLIFRKP